VCVLERERESELSPRWQPSFSYGESVALSIVETRKKRGTTWGASWSGGAGWWRGPRGAKTDGSLLWPHPSALRRVANGDEHGAKVIFREKAETFKK